MSAIVHISANGTVQLPPEILARIQPGAAYEVHTENARVVMEPVVKQEPFWKTATPAERVERFQRWVDHMPKRDGPPIPDEALRRENLYD